MSSDPKKRQVFETKARACIIHLLEPLEEEMYALCAQLKPCLGFKLIPETVLSSLIQTTCKFLKNLSWLSQNVPSITSFLRIMVFKIYRLKSPRRHRFVFR